MPQTIPIVLLDFLDYLFSNDEGYVVIATTRPPAKRDTYNEQFFDWPKQRDTIVDYIEKVTPTHNVYFCVNIFDTPRRIKENAIPQNLVWADLDLCRPDQLEIPPQCVIESSPNHYQAIWRLDQKIDPTIAENYSKRIAYYHAELGVDKSGHDVTQLLRVPGTYNFKYQLGDTPQVQLRTMLDHTLPIDMFEALPPPTISDVDISGRPVPDDTGLATPEMILYRHRGAMEQTGLLHTFARYYSEEPTSDWSKSLWRLIIIAFDVGMTTEEVFVIAKHSKCNKYERDGRPDSHLWRDVLKGEATHATSLSILSHHRYLTMPELLSLDEVNSLQPTIIDDYKDWATQATDAVPVYHDLSCAVLLSALMSTTLRLDAGVRPLVPNLWALILGDSTLTRKTTAMDMAMDFVLEIDRDLVLGSDVSAEGIMSALSGRPHQVSIFHRDEVSGFLESVRRKEYLSSLPEIMTKMYDVPKHMVRRLRKDTFVVSEPIFIFFGGGVPDKTYSLIDEEYFIGGFIPRFLVVRGYAEQVRHRPYGPPIEQGFEKRLALYQTFHALYNMYTNQQAIITAPDGSQTSIIPEIKVTADSAVWSRAAELENTLLDAARTSPEANKALPTFSRMYFSLLKLAMLLAAARQEPQEHVIKLELRDLLSAASYIQQWGEFAVDLVVNSGMIGDEVRIRAIYRTVDANPGIQRGQVMNRHRINSKEMSLYEDTLVQRGQITVLRRGHGKQYYPTGR